jgi:hypothetical protein
VEIGLQNILFVIVAETQADGHVTDELSTKVSAGANYLGSMFSNAWTKTAKTANDASATSSSFLSTTFSPKVGTPATNSEGNYSNVMGGSAKSHVR